MFPILVRISPQSFYLIGTGTKCKQAATTSKKLLFRLNIRISEMHV